MERASRVVVVALVAALALSGGAHLWQSRALGAERARIAEAKRWLVVDLGDALGEAERLIQDGLTSGKPTSLLLAADELAMVQRTLNRIRGPLLGGNEAIAQAEGDLVGLSKQVSAGRDALLKRGALSAEERDGLIAVGREVTRIRNLVSAI